MWNINQLKSFIISRSTIRFVRAFFYNQIFPYLKYFFYILTILLVLTTIYLAIFKKPIFEQIKNRLTKYSYKIINFKNAEDSYSIIKIEGNERTSYEEIVNLARTLMIKDRNFDNQTMIRSLKGDIEKLPWVDEVVISISLQDSLNINIKEHQPFAMWEDKDKKYVVSKAGKIISVGDVSRFDNLVVLTGQNAYKNVQSLFNILAIDPKISQNVYSATWVGGRRWDVRFENGLLAKLPSNNSGNDIKEAWDSLIKIYNMPGSLNGLKAIDLRIAKKIYLEYDEGVIKELKNY